jgi:hypothetical protein
MAREVPRHLRVGRPALVEGRPARVICHGLDGVIWLRLEREDRVVGRMASELSPAPKWVAIPMVCFRCRRRVDLVAFADPSCPLGWSYLAAEPAAPGVRPTVPHDCAPRDLGPADPIDDWRQQ